MQRKSGWQTYAVSVQGARHTQCDDPCQDACGVSNEDDLVVICVADGHGDPKHARSDVGSRIAVEVAIDLLTEVGREMISVCECPNPRQIERDLKVHLPMRLSWEWNRRVKIDLGLPEPNGEWHEDIPLYGTTVVVAMFTQRLGLFLQLGDGDILVVDESGSRCVFGLDDDVYGSVTHSLCQTGSPAYARVACTQMDEPKLVLLCTDGVRDSLQGQPSAFYGVGNWFLSRIEREGWDEAIEALPSWLEELSRLGNGDDATMGVVHWREA